MSLARQIKGGADLNDYRAGRGVLYALCGPEKAGSRGGTNHVPGRTIWKALPKFILFFLGTVLLNTYLSNTVADNAFYQTVFQPFFTNGYKFFL